MNTEDIKRMVSLFRGFDDAYGTTDITGANEETGKTEAVCYTIEKPVTEALWTKHLEGKKGFGIIPLTSDNKCHWGVADIDVYDINLKDLERQIKALDLPLFVFRTKSGGAHAYVFFSKPVPAVKAMKKLNEWAAALGHGGCEVFPKQSKRVDKSDIGNFLNMPYFKAELTTRYLIHEGQDKTMEEMLDICEAGKITEEQLESWEVPVKEDITELFEGGPPCLKMLMNLGGFPSGTRNMGMFNVGVYLRKRFSDDWEDKLMEYNQELCDPKLPKNELDALCDSLKKKDTYEYRCNEAPIKAYCNRQACITCPFGIGNDGGTFLGIDNLTKLEGDPVLWYVQIGESRLCMTSEDLLNQTKFKQKVMETVMRVPTTMKSNKWTDLLDHKIQNAHIIQSPQEATSQGEFQHLLRQYLTGHSQAKTKEELKSRGAPFHDDSDGCIYFKGAGLWRYLDTNSFKYKSKHHIWQILKSKYGCEQQVIRIDEKITMKAWKINADQLDKIEDEEEEGINEE